MSASHLIPPAGALTTVFTPSDPYCTTGLFRFQTFSCMPPNYLDFYWRSDRGYYSPAICPSGYTSACSRNPNGAISSFGGPMLPSETAITCCPTSYACGMIYSNCIYTGTEITTAIEPLLTYTGAPPQAYPVQIRWQASDLSNLETHPLTPGAKPTSLGSLASNPTSLSSLAPATATTNPERTTDTNAINDVASDGLSTGAKVGIGVGVGVVFLGILLGIVLVLLRRRKKRELAIFEVQNIDADNSLDAGQAMNQKPAAFEIQNVASEGSSDLAQTANKESALFEVQNVAAEPPLYSENATKKDSTVFEIQNVAESSSGPTGIATKEYNDKLERLQEEQARLEERKSRLKEIHQIEEEQERIRAEMQHLNQGRHPR